MKMNLNLKWHFQHPAFMHHSLKVTLCMAQEAGIVFRRVLQGFEMPVQSVALCNALKSLFCLSLALAFCVVNKYRLDNKNVKSASICSHQHTIQWMLVCFTFCHSFFHFYLYLIFVYDEKNIVFHTQPQYHNPP